VLAYLFGFYISMAIGLFKELLDGGYSYFPPTIQKFLRKFLFCKGTGFSLKDLIADGIGSYIGFRTMLIYGLKIIF